MAKNNILIINGSPKGNKGNCAQLIRLIENSISSKYSIDVLTLANKNSKSQINHKLHKTSGFIFVTGTYWDSWGSPLQKFLEDITHLEGTQAFLGKPCSVFVLNHSVGGKAVLSKLQGVLSTLGCMIPPMSGMVYSLVNDLIIRKVKTKFADDLWSYNDIPVIVHNLEKAMKLDIKMWKSWAIDRNNFEKNWI